MRVVIVPESDVTEGIRDCLLSWSRVGLLGPFCLWQVPLGGGGEVSDRVDRIEAGDHRAGSLAEALQGTHSDQVALVGLYAAGAREKFDGVYAERIEECLEISRKVLAFEKGKPIECTVLIAPEEIAQPTPLEVFCGTWNLYVAPEDRASPPEANQLLSGEDLLARHAAHALATIADLWANAAVQPTKALRSITGQEAFAIDPPAVRVVRSFSRVIDLGYLSDHIAAGVFKAGKAWPNPSRHRFDRAEEPARLVAMARREFIAVHGELIGLTAYEPETLPPEVRPNIWQALRELIQMIRARLEKLPSEFADATLGKAHDRLAAMIDRYRGEGAPRTLRWKERPAEDRNLVDLTAELNAALPTPDGATATVWRELRELALGLIDGSSLPGSIKTENYVRADKRILVTNPDAIVPDPEVRPPFPDAERACDPIHLEPKFALPDGGRREDGDPQRDDPDAELRERLEEWSARLRPTLLWGVGVEIAEAREVAKAAAEELEAQALAAETATQQPADGESSEDDTTSEEKSGEADEEEGSRAEVGRWRALRNRFLAFTGLAVVASAVVWPRLQPLAGAGAQGAILVAWATAMIRVALRFVLNEREIVRKAMLAQLAIVNAAMRRALYAGDLPRLERRYAEYLDWAEIVGWMAHHPWVGEPIGRVEVKAPVRQSTLPSAFRVAAGVVTPEKIDALCTQARARVFDTGWLREQYQASLEDAQRRIDLSQSYSGESGPADPDADTNEEPDSPRRVLRDAIRRGDGRHLKDNELTAEVLGFMSQLPLDRTATEITTSLALWSAEDGSDQLEALPPCPAWFAPPQGMEDLAPRILAGVVRISAQTLAGPQVGLGALVDAGVVTSHRVVDGASAIRVQLADGSACQASVTRRYPEADLALLEMDEVPEGLEGGLEFADVEPQIGELILAPSPPERDPDQPDVALGLVVRGSSQADSGPAVGFGTSYRTAAGPAGSPVFDLSGRLVGIHRVALDGADPGEGTVRAVTGVADVRLMLAGEAPEDLTVAHLARPRRGRIEDPPHFLAALFETGSGSIGLLPQHWIDSDEQHMPEIILGGGDFGSSGLEELATPARFLEPVRVIVHRVDISSALAARELASCAASPLSPVAEA